MTRWLKTALAVLWLMVALGTGIVTLAATQSSATKTAVKKTSPLTKFKAKFKIRPRTKTRGPAQAPAGLEQRETITVQKTGASYKSVTTKPNGWLTTGQEADIMLSGIDFNNTGGPLLFNHPGGIATDGSRLLLADRNNNRLLIWQTLPTANTPPDLVLGQPDFTQNNPGTGLNQFNWPSSVSAADGKVVVADTENHRILIWNSFPRQNAQPADLVLELPQISHDLDLGNFEWPWGVWTDGTKLAVANTHGSHVFLWNTFPTQNNQLPAVALNGQGKFGTPRSITSNGQYLIVSDHNAKVTIARPGGSGPQGDGPATFVWKSWPTHGDQPYDFVLDGWRSGSFLSDNRLILLSSTHFPPAIWNAPPTDASDEPDLILGNSAGVGAPGYYFVTGDGPSLAAAGGRLYFNLSNGNKIVVYNSLPTDQLKKPDFAIGAPDVETSTLHTNFFITNPLVATDGHSLFAASDFGTMSVWKTLPEESGAQPDFVYNLLGQRKGINFNPTAIAVGNNRLALAGRAAGNKPTVYLWKKLPKNGELPDLQFQNSIGGAELSGEAIGVAIDEKYFYLSNGPASKIYVWEGLPDGLSEPKFTLAADFPRRLSSDGRNLLAVLSANRSPGSHTVGVFDLTALTNSSRPTILPTNPQEQDIGRRFNGINSALVAGGHLFIADTGFGRVHVWTDLKDGLAGKRADIMLGAADWQDIRQEIGQDKLFWPATLAFDGSYLWVGEFKFSGRIVRFPVR